MKRILAIAVVFCCLMTVIPYGVISVSADEESGLLYVIENDEAIVTGVSGTVTGEMTVPSTLGGYPVTVIGGNAFYNRDDFRSISLPDTVTTIGDKAFYGCGFETLDIPQGVVRIGNHAFQNCYYLTSIVVPDRVTELGNRAFSGCSVLSSVVLGKNVKTIGDYAFNSCGGVSSLTK